MRIDHSQDYLTVMNAETVTYTSTRKTGSMIDAIRGCWRSELTRTEKAASGGVYGSAACALTIPRRKLAEGFEPKPADVWKGREGVDYTVQSVNGQVHDFQGRPNYYRLQSLSLSILHDLRDKIDIQRPSITYDAAGAKVKGWTDEGGIVLYKNLAARVQDQGGSTVEERAIAGLKHTFQVFVGRPVNDVTLEDRIKLVRKGVTYYLSITAVRQPDRIDELPVIEAELAV